MDLYSIDLSKPKWSQDTYIGRAKHFFTVTNPLNILLKPKDLDASKELLEKHRNHNLPNGTSVEDLWKAKYRYESAFHPDTKEKMFILGRMSAQVPMNMAITGCMITFYKTAPAVIFWQWINQSFNAIVNYTNRSGDAPMSNKKLLQSYVVATSSAVVTALSLNNVAKRLPPLFGRFVPFAAVAAANCINIPLMRSNEIKDGIMVTTKTGENLTTSQKAAKSAIAQVVFSRIGMAIPGMVIPPIVMNKISDRRFLRMRPWLTAPIQVGMVGFCLVFATPLCCALFPQQSSMSVCSLEEHVQEHIMKINKHVDEVYFNKGL